MKKLISLLLSCMMLFSIAVVMPVYAADVTINAKDVMAGGQGTGFYDNSGELSEGEGEPESAEDSQIYLRANEWVKYDIAANSITAGTYEVSVKMKTNGSERQRVFLDLYVDDMLFSKTEAGIRVNSYTDLSLGKVYIGSSSSALKIKNSVLYDGFYAALESITLTYVSADDSTADDYNIYYHAHNIKSLDKAADASSDGGYWDAAGATLPNGGIIENNAYTQHAGDWAKYDISGLKPGTYTIYLEACATANPNMSMTIDGNVVFLDRAFTSTGSYSVPREDGIGMFYVDGTEQELKLSTSTAAVFVRGIRFDYESEDNLTLSTSQRVEAEAPIPGGQNEAYYDNGTVATRIDVLEINAGATGSTICHRTNEWVKYSIKNLLPGRYALTLSSASIVEVTLKVELDDEVHINEYILPKQTSYSDYQTNRIGYLNIETSDEIIMKVSHVGGGVATYIDYFELNRVEPFEVEGLTTNISSYGDVTRGADVLKVQTSNVVNSKTYANAKVKNADGKVLAADVALGAENKEIIISLKETFDYSSDYVVDLSGVTDDFDQNFEESYINFTTSDELADEGTATLDSVFTEKEETKTTYRGKVLASSSLGIAGRTVTLSGTLPSGEALEDKTAVTDSDGEYEFVIDYSDATESGAYTYAITTDYVSRNKTYTDTFYTADVNETLCSAVNGKATWEEAKDALITNAGQLGINAEGTGLGIDMQYVYEGFVNRGFTNASDIRDEFNKYVVTEKINQAVDVALLADVINNREVGAVLGFNYEIWDMLTAENQEMVQDVIFEADRITLPSDMAEFLKDVLAARVSTQYAVDSGAIAVTFPTVAEGNGGVIEIGFAQKTENVTKIHLELAYTDGTVFENDPVKVNVKVKDARKTVERDTNKIIIDIERDYTLDDITDICDVTFTTLSGEAGNYDVTVSGYAAFDLVNDGIVEGNTNIDFPADVSGVFTVNEKSSSSGRGDYTPSGGGNGGGTSIYPTISLPVVKDEQTETPAPTETPSQSSEIFSDLSEAAWAKDSIVTLAKMGVVSGRGDGTFDPNSSVSRAEFLKILLGVHKIEAGGTAGFKDVKETDWFCPYVAKAAELGIVTGDENGYFSPNAEITRQDMAVISYRLLAQVSEVKKADPAFNDSWEISDYAKEAVGSLYRMGMINGVGNNSFAPKIAVSRAMAAKFAYNILYPQEVAKPTVAPTETPKEEIGDRAITAEIQGDKLAVRTSYDETSDLVQQFIGFSSDNMNANGVINFASASLVDKAETNIFAGGKTLSLSTDEVTPFLINTSYIGANHGQSSGILVKASHNKTYADIGSIWKDETGTEFTLLKIADDGSLLFISDNAGTSKTNWSFVNEIKGNLEYVSDGINKEAITVTSYAGFQQIFSSTRIKEHAVYAVVDGIGYKLSEGDVAECDYIDIVEKYDIINPATIGDALRKNKPTGGYTENQCLAVGEAIIDYSMTYRITPDGTVMSIFDHEILGDINFRSYGAIQQILRNDIYGGGVHLYLPKVGSFTAENGTEYNFSKPKNITTGDIPNVTVSSLYWDKETDAPNRMLSYMRDSGGADIMAFAGGYLPVDDAALDKRNEMTNASIMLYHTKKLYPYFATAKAFEKTGTKGQHLTGAAYRKYADMTNTLSTLGLAYTVPYENDMYIYVDYQKTGQDTINLPETLAGKKIELVEKSDNVAYEAANGVVAVKVTAEKDYGYLVLKVSGGGYGTNTYSKTDYSDKYIAK